MENLNSVQWSQIFTTRLSTDKPPDPFVRKSTAPAQLGVGEAEGNQWEGMSPDKSETSLLLRLWGGRKPVVNLSNSFHPVSLTFR